MKKVNGKKTGSIFRRMHFRKKGAGHAGAGNVTIKAKLITAFILLSVLPATLIALLVYNVSKDTLEQKVQDLSQDVGYQISSSYFKRYGCHI
ncbi:hypothetical protein [Salipaludibacillus keqinensis]|nr:hypothetical protein [Salipaludibacillus keqinensis]